MKLRQARKIAEKCRGMRPPDCPYDEWTLFRAFSRLHTAWRCTREEWDSEHGRIHGVTPDYTRETAVWTMLIRARFFRRNRYRADAPRNPAIDSWVRRTWSPPQS